MSAIGALLAKTTPPRDEHPRDEWWEIALVLAILATVGFALAGIVIGAAIIVTTIAEAIL